MPSPCCAKVARHESEKFMIVAGAAVRAAGRGRVAFHAPLEAAGRSRRRQRFRGSQNLRWARSRRSASQGRRQPNHPAPQCRRLDRGGAPVPGGCAAGARARAGHSPDCESSNRRPAIRLTTQSLASRRPTSRPPEARWSKWWRARDLVADRRQGRRRPRRLRAQACRGGRALLAQPFITADPDQKRWIDRLITDIPGANVHDIAVKPAAAPSYLLTRADRGADRSRPEPAIPKGRTPVEPDVAQWPGRRAGRVPLRRRARVAGATGSTRRRTARPIAPSTARSSSSPGIAVKATRPTSRLSTRRDPAARREVSEPAAAAAGRAARPLATFRPRRQRQAAAKPAGSDRGEARRALEGVEFEIPAYKYEAIFKEQEELLERMPAPAPKRRPRRNSQA